MDTPSKSTGALECAVCLQPCIHPAQLPCGHIFCFLCVKGVANQSKRCAMCRQEIPCDYLENPSLINPSVEGGIVAEQEVTDNEFQWFYEGRNGWWKYDVRTNKELDLAFQRGVRCCELLIAGFLYIIDFDSMLQLRRNDPSRRRRIKRDVISIPVKGVAGIKFKNENRVKTPEMESIDEVTLVPPSNTPASAAHSGEVTPNNIESFDRSADQIRSLSLDTVMGLIAEGMNLNESSDIENSDMNIDQDKAM